MQGIAGPPGYPRGAVARPAIVKAFAGYDQTSRATAGLRSHSGGVFAFAGQSDEFVGCRTLP